MRFECGPEPRLALESSPGVLELVTGVFEFTLEHALLTDRLAAFGRARRLPREQGEQDAIVIEEEGPGIGMDDQPPLASQVGFDRKGDGGIAGRFLAIARGGSLKAASDLHRRRRRPVDDPDRGRRPERNDRRRSVGDGPGGVCESDPQRIRVPVDRGTEEALAEVERDRPLLQPPKRRGWDERGQVAQPSHERQDPGDGRDTRVRRPGGGGGGRSGARDEDRDREEDRRGGGDPQARAGVPDSMSSRTEEQPRGDRLDRDEVADDEESERRVPARPDPDPDDRRPEPDQ